MICTKAVGTSDLDVLSPWHSDHASIVTVEQVTMHCNEFGISRHSKALSWCHLEHLHDNQKQSQLPGSVVPLNMITMWFMYDHLL